MLFCSSADPAKIERALRESVELLERYEPDRVIVTVAFRIYPGCDLVWIATREGIIGAGANLLSPKVYFSPLVKEWIWGYLDTVMSRNRRWTF
jgi:hypothetical protein